MAKNKTILFCFLLLISSTGLFSQNTDSIRQRVVEIYSAEVGVREATGRNDGAEVEKYLASTGLSGGYAWCAAFVAWTFEQADIRTVKSAWSPAWFPEGKTIYVRGNPSNMIPQRADVFGIYFSNLRRIAHVGFIDEWQESSSFAITVEGNTNGSGSREGDGVYRKRRLKSQVYKVSRWIN